VKTFPRPELTSYGHFRRAVQVLLLALAAAATFLPAGGLARFDWSVPRGTDGLIVELGANDMLRGADPSATETSLAQILDKARALHIPTLLAGMRAAPNLGADYQQRFDAIYPDLAKRYDAAFYPFFLAAVAGDPKLNQQDGLHPTREGVDRIVAAMLPTVQHFLVSINP
jgi:acyl-CoA thioesterase I